MTEEECAESYWRNKNQFAIQRQKTDKCFIAMRFWFCTLIFVLVVSSILICILLGAGFVDA